MAAHDYALTFDLARQAYGAVRDGAVKAGVPVVASSNGWSVLPPTRGSVKPTKRDYSHIDRIGYGPGMIRPPAIDPPRVGPAYPSASEIQNEGFGQRGNRAAWVFGIRYGGGLCRRPGDRPFPDPFTAYLLGLVKAEGDLIGYVARNGGPVWIARGFIRSTFLISAVILWRVAPEILKSWKARLAGPRNSDSRSPQA